MFKKLKAGRTMDRPAVISAKGLTRKFGDLTAVNNLVLDVYPGEVLGFLGHNGAGKTTTVRLLNGVIKPTDGVMRVLGLDPTTQGAKLRQHTGVLTETPSVDERLTGYENLQIFGRLYNVPEGSLHTKIDELLDLFQLTDRAKDRVSEYSKGMKQKLALARALIHKPQLLFLDEPTSGLDPVITRQVHTLIRDLSQTGLHTVFLCTHNLQEAQRLCDRVAVLENGKMAALGEPEKLARDLWRGLRLEIETKPKSLEIAVSILQTHLDAIDIVQKERPGFLSLSLTQKEQIPEIISHLAAQDVPIYRITPEEPTLEDVYFALHKRGGNNA